MPQRRSPLAPASREAEEGAPRARPASRTSTKAQRAIVARLTGAPPAPSSAPARRPPRFAPTKAQRDLVESLVAFGLTAEQIAAYIVDPRTGNAISRATLFRHFRVNLANGLPRANAVVAGALFEQAKKGVVPAQIFWLKSRGGWREQAPDTPTTTAKPVRDARERLAEQLEQMATRLGSIDGGAPGDAADERAPADVADTVH